MVSPVTEKDHQSFPEFTPSSSHRRASSDEDGTLRDMDHNNLHHTTSYAVGQDHLSAPDRDQMQSPGAREREERRQQEDDFLMMAAEKAVNKAAEEAAAADDDNTYVGRTKSLARTRSRNAPSEPVDDFDIGTTPIHEKNKIYKPPADPATKFAKFFKSIHQSSFLVRYFCYIAPLVILLLIPLLFGLFLFKDATVGGVRLFWFGIWLEIVWLTLWAGRILAKCIPWPMGMIASLFTNNSKKWRDLGKALEVPATLFFWWLAIEVSFLPTMTNHHLDGVRGVRGWEKTANKVIVSIFVGVILNFVEKIIIQLIAISFHLRTYADRIEINQFQISSLMKLYIYSKEKLSAADSEFEERPDSAIPSGARTPMVYVEKAKQRTTHVFHKVGDAAGKMAGDFTGKETKSSTHPHQVILQLLNSTTGSQVLARRLYRTFVRPDFESVFNEDLRLAYDNDDEADAAFAMFDKDLNGDISMDELEAVCVEIGRERKAITASLKDLDSVVSKLDDVFFFIVFIITILVFISLISSSASTALTSAGSTVLALSWLFSATAQEFLQSLIFVFVKHPFDVGDRVKIYGNTGAAGLGDDYFVKEIALLYTEFKKMEGHVVQAPNSYLNTLFILNQRRSGGLAEAVPVTVKFGTTLEQIETLRSRLLEFVTSENREYQKNILTELHTIYEAHSITLNVVFFYKSNWQNELLRLQRRNKFICAMMVTMQELGIEGPRMRLAGAVPEFPMHLNNAYAQQGGAQGSGPQNPPFGGRSDSVSQSQDQFVPQSATGSAPPGPSTHPSILRTRGASTLSGRQRGESIAAMGKRVDFSLGMQGISSGADYGDVYDEPKPRIPVYRRPSQVVREDSDGEESLRRAESRDSASGSLRTHRTRFWGKSKRSMDDGVDLSDLEAGTGRERNFVGEMPDIPEASGGNSAVSPQATWDKKASSRDRSEMGRARGRGVTIAEPGESSGNEAEKENLMSMRRAETDRR